MSLLMVSQSHYTLTVKVQNEDALLLDVSVTISPTPTLMDHVNNSLAGPSNITIAYDTRRPRVTAMQVLTPHTSHYAPVARQVRGEWKLLVLLRVTFSLTVHNLNSEDIRVSEGTIGNVYMTPCASGTYHPAGGDRESDTCVNQRLSVKSDPSELTVTCPSACETRDATTSTNTINATVGNACYFLGSSEPCVLGLGKNDGNSKEFSVVVEVYPTGTSGEVSLEIPPDVVKSKAGNGNDASGKWSSAFDNVLPVAVAQLQEEGPKLMLVFSETVECGDGFEDRVSITGNNGVLVSVVSARESALRDSSTFTFSLVVTKSVTTPVTTTDTTTTTTTVSSSELGDPKKEPEEPGLLTVHLAADSCKDQADNGNANQTFTFAFGNNPPSIVRFTTDASLPSIKESVSVILQTNQPVKTLREQDIEISAGTVEALTKRSSTLYQFEVHALSPIAEVVVTIPAGALEDMSGITNKKTASLTLPFDYATPAMLYARTDLPSPNVQRSTTVEITFSELVTEVEVGDFFVRQGEMTSLLQVPQPSWSVKYAYHCLSSEGVLEELEADLAICQERCWEIGCTGFIQDPSGKCYLLAGDLTAVPWDDDRRCYMPSTKRTEPKQHCQRDPDNQLIRNRIKHRA